MTRREKYLKNKVRELRLMKIWQIKHRKPCPECDKEISYQGKFCRSCSQKGERHFAWQREKVSYNALHLWVRTNLGRPKFCEECKTIKAKKYDWANKSYLYKRDKSDWVRLCRSCHTKRDVANGRKTSFLIYPERSNNMTALVVD